MGSCIPVPQARAAESTPSSTYTSTPPANPGTSNPSQPSFYLNLPLTPTSLITIQPFSHTPSPLLESLLDLSHPVTSVWPDFITHAPTEANSLFEKIMVDERWTPFQLAAILHSGSSSFPGAKIIGQANSIPFHWPTPNESSTLPDRGWDRVLAMGSSPEKAPGPANALSALSVAIDPDYRASKLSGIDLAAEMLKGLKRIAENQGFEALVVPVRPTRKGAGGNVWVDMDRYIRCRRGEDPPTKILSGGENKQQEEELEMMDQKDLYDPWLRKHIEMGAKMVKVCWESAIIESAVEDWEKWTGVSFKVPSVNPYRCIKRGKEMDMGQSEGDKEESYEVVIPGGLVPVRVFPKRKFVEEDGVEKVGVGLYVEPNVWVRHF
ncbi:hypothetical protein L211DRAFT_869001 [Terfezia boudieri ATCC MYA-4762]|uniref:Uncharacterized protein n=1 Tax=Terfezia boudieri ATCC MYA-4762 TaxID=1051890 RepID=A0A3N4LQ86_9PEZI|nr:hypothetical protein L211DRAFT_869001 [Terfezia boudieri ATCC MYA-4762]